MTNDILRQSKVDQLTTKNYDLHGRRVVNASDAVGNADYVTKRQLDKVTSESYILKFVKKYVDSVRSLVLRIISPYKDSDDALRITKSDRKTDVVVFNTQLGTPTVDFTSTIRAMSAAAAAPTSGTSVEIRYNASSGTGAILSYNRTAGTAQPLLLTASDFTISTTTLGFFNATPAAKQTLNAYTSDSEGVAYTGIATGVVGTPYAAVADLNQLRVAYETLRASYDDLRTKLKNTTLVG